MKRCNAKSATHITAGSGDGGSLTCYRSVRGSLMAPKVGVYNVPEHEASGSATPVVSRARAGRLLRRSVGNDVALHQRECRRGICRRTIRDHQRSRVVKPPLKLPKGSFSYYPIHTIPTMLDVVWCKFPDGEAPDEPAKPRPALVRAVLLYAEHKRAAVEVSYGTSKIKAVHNLDLQISNCEEMAAGGLPQATAFRLGRTVRLPWAKEFFSPREGCKTPIIGHLHVNSISQLEALKVMRRGKNID